jgi:hypothetical protein
MPTDLNYKRKLSTRRNWLFGNYSASLELVFPEHAHSFSFSVHALLSALLPTQVQSLYLHAGTSALVENLKGKDCPQSPHRKHTSTQVSDELIRIRGTLFEPLTTIDTSEQVEQYSDFFEVSVHTTFDSFSPLGSIFHRAEVSTSNEMLAVLRLIDLPQAIPLRLESVRIGLDLFQRPSGWTWFSRTPVVTSSLLLDSSPASTSLIIESEGLPSKNSSLLPSPVPTMQLINAAKAAFNAEIEGEFPFDS